LTIEDRYRYNSVPSLLTSARDTKQKTRQRVQSKKCKYHSSPENSNIGHHLEDKSPWQLMSEYALPNATLPEGFTAIGLPVDMDAIRSIISIDQNRCLVLERQGSSSNVVLLYVNGTDDDDDDEEDDDDIPEPPKPSFGSDCGRRCRATTNTGIFNQRRIVVSASGINHGLVIHKNYLYASSSSHVYRWPYDPVTAQVTGEAQTVIDNINAIDQIGTGASTGQHSTRSLIFDDQDRLLVSVGSIGNVDVNSFRARIRRFTIPPNGDSGDFPFNYATGEIFADGLRNEVGLEWDRYGILWGVQTGPDNLNRLDLGGAIINDDNPAELLHAFRQEGFHYGYPYCWMEYKLPNGVGLGPGTMWAWPTFMATVSDAQCRNSSIYTPAELPMQSHSSPLGMAFYEYKQEDELATGCSGAFPQWMDGYAFIAFHGSWNRQISTGYKVVYVPINVTTGQVAADDAIDLLAHSGSGAKWPDGFRPVDVDFDECGRLLVSSDGTSGQGTKVVRIDYNEARDRGRLPYDDPSNRHRDLTAPTSGSNFALCCHSLMLSAFIFLIISRAIIF
jgi:glucose/arabinose dehydrogenase